MKNIRMNVFHDDKGDHDREVLKQWHEVGSPNHQKLHKQSHRSSAICKVVTPASTQDISNVVLQVGTSSTSKEPKKVEMIKNMRFTKVPTTIEDRGHVETTCKDMVLVKARP